MTLAAALQTARVSLANAAAQSALISRNVGSADQPGYARRVADLTSDPQGAGAHLAVRRIVEEALRNAALEAGARAEGATTTFAGLERLDVVMGTRSGADGLPAALGALRDSLLAWSNEPSRAGFGDAALRAAADVAGRLHRIGEAVDDLRSRADADLAVATQTVNDLLARFKSANDAVVGARAVGRDASDAQDERDAVLAALSREIGVTARPQRNGGLALYADGGLTLFEREPRRVEFVASGPLVSGAVGAALRIDGVDATSAASTMPIGAGRIAALIELRDRVGVELQAQLDETARALVTQFAESDQLPSPAAPTLAGLFVDPRQAGVPDAAEAVGLARRIAIAANADPARGGDATRIRDGGVAVPGDPAYVYNQSGDSGFNDRLLALAGAFAAPFAFDARAGLAADNLTSFAGESFARFAGSRSAASAAAEREAAVRDRTVESLSNATGVDVDEEMSRLLDVERAYQASAKLLAAVDSMFGELLAAMR